MDVETRLLCTLLGIIVACCAFSGCAATGQRNAKLFWGAVEWENFAGQEFSIGHRNIDFTDARSGVDARQVTPKGEKY